LIYRSLAWLAIGRAYYTGQGVTQDRSKAVSWFEKADAQNEPNAAFMLALCHQQKNAALSEQYFQRARQAVWLSQDAHALVPQVSALSVSDHFAKWHYLNFHQHIVDGFRDAGRQPRGLISDRETIHIDESHPALQRFASEAQQLVAQISGEPTWKSINIFSLIVPCHL
jgi:TPR repeat protein